MQAVEVQPDSHSECGEQPSGRPSAWNCPALLAFEKNLKKLKVYVERQRRGSGPRELKGGVIRSRGKYVEMHATGTCMVAWGWVTHLVLSFPQPRQIGKLRVTREIVSWLRTKGLALLSSFGGTRFLAVFPN